MTPSRCDWCGKEGHEMGSCAKDDKLTTPARQHPSMELVEAIAWGQTQILARNTRNVENAVADARRALPPGGLRTMPNHIAVGFRVIVLAVPRLKEMEASK